MGSTQQYIIKYTKKYGYTTPLIVVANHQTKGVGSNDNSWIGIEGNLFFSFVINQDMLPEDLPIQSSSIYFSCLLQDIFSSFGSKCYIKWPNDFYIKDKKIGGTITKISSSLLYCGIGINIHKPNDNFGKLDIKLDKEHIISQLIAKTQIVKTKASVKTQIVKTKAKAKAKNKDEISKICITDCYVVICIVDNI